jgi:curved DNA-binding protein
MKYSDYYAALGLTRNATLEQIKKVYRTLARRHHPDMFKAADTEDKFKKAAAAYATPKNPEKRVAYDALGVQKEGPDMDEAKPAHQADSRFEDIDFSDFLDSLGKGGLFGKRPGQTRRPQRGRDMEDTVLVDLAQALHDNTLHMALIDQSERRDPEVFISAGVRAGKKLRLRGKGGDFYLHIAFSPHPRLRVDQQDLYFDLVLSPWEAMLGADISVPALEGEVVLSVPPGRSSGKKLRARGMPNGPGADAKRGDMYA